ncbi:MAG: gluconate 2-dehydrogenase subunit 3 family protein [Rhizobiales bacterium]|nr:gluconate 2-dehydrogenase subunit 3 family protein [Hyphomicrobiales bacterium]
MTSSPSLTAAELAFLTAAVDTLIPADDLSPSGSDCGVVDFIEWQLASPWGEGAGLYRDGPFFQAKPEHGYQLRFTPRELFRAGIAAANVWTRSAHGKDFNQLADIDRIAALKAFEEGSAEFSGVPSKEVFEALLNLTMEGFFADPIYGGNRDCSAWKMIGYPGLPARYREAVSTSFGKRYDQPPRSIADFS